MAHVFNFLHTTTIEGAPPLRPFARVGTSPSKQPNFFHNFFFLNVHTTVGGWPTFFDFLHTTTTEGALPLSRPLRQGGDPDPSHYSRSLQYPGLRLVCASAIT